MARSFEPVEVFCHAAKFEATALLAFNDTQIKLSDQRNFDGDKRLLLLYTPGITNSAFALELYFKTLIWIESAAIVRIREHRILPLFNMISAARQQRIIELYDQEVADSDWINRLKNEFPSELPNYQIPKIFEDANNAFVELRYYFEGIETANHCAFFPAVPATRRAILEIHPEWQKFLGDFR